MTPQTSIPRLRPVIRVFVSSTFSDLKPERNALQAQVFPKLEQLCAQNGFQFQAIDLRWGVSSEAGLDHRTMRMCFDELRRAQEISPRPNFLILLGNRYGWRPLPEEISVKEFEELKKVATTDHTDKHKSEVKDPKPEIRSLPAIREIREIRGQSLDPLAVFNAWYRRDENAVPPVYLLQSRRQQLPDAKDYTQAALWNVNRVRCRISTIRGLSRRIVQLPFAVTDVKTVAPILLLEKADAVFADESTTEERKKAEGRRHGFAV